MTFKTVILIIISVLATIIIMQNNEIMHIKLLWKEYEISKLLVLLSFLILGIIVGLFIGSGRRKKQGDMNYNKGTLSEEDREFIEP